MANVRIVGAADSKDIKTEEEAMDNEGGVTTAAKKYRKIAVKRFSNVSVRINNLELGDAQHVTTRSEELNRAYEVAGIGADDSLDIILPGNLATILKLLEEIGYIQVIDDDMEEDEECLTIYMVKQVIEQSA